MLQTEPCQSSSNNWKTSKSKPFYYGNVLFFIKIKGKKYLIQATEPEIKQIKQENNLKSSVVWHTAM